MGNYASCAIAGGAAGRKAVRVILPGGEVRTFKEPLNAAELMLDAPNCFVVDTRSLHPGHRFSALTADDDLLLGGVYALFPMKRLNSVIAARDMGGLFLAANKKSKARVAPEIEQEAVEEMVEELRSPEFGHWRPMCRAKKPVLETIVEEPMYAW